MGVMWGDFQYGLRQIRRRPFFTAVVVLLLAIGIGSNTLVFSLIDELLLKPLPVRNPENLYVLERVRELQVRPDTFFRYAAYRDVVRSSRAISAAVAEEESLSDGLVAMQSGDSVRLVMTEIVSPNYFSELGVSAVVGRVLTESDGAEAGAVAAVLSYQFWQSQFGGRREVIGTDIRLKGHRFLVAGVLPREFHSSDIDRAPDVRLPISAARILGRDDLQANMRILVRLAPGVTPRQAADSLSAQMKGHDEWAWRESNARAAKPLAADYVQKELDSELNYRLVLEPMGRGASRLRDQFSRALWLLLGGVGLLLLAVCVNVAGLLLARADERRRETAIRAAVGAGRWQLVRQHLVECVLLALPGAGVGAVLAFAAAPWVVRLLPPARDYSHVVSPQLLTVSPDPRVLFYAFALTGLCVLAFGLLPAWRSTRPSLVGEWKATAARSHQGMAAIAPVAVQAGFCVLLLAAAALMLRTYWNLRRLDPGFDRAHLAEFTFEPAHAGYTPEQIRNYYRELRRRVEALPGVRSTAYASVGVMRGSGMKMTLAPVGVVLPRNTFLNTSVNNVMPGYFETMGMPLLAGRDLSRADVGRRPSPIVVNQALADSLFPHQDPLGRLLVPGRDGNQEPTVVIVGLTTTAKYRSMREPDPPTFYGVRDETPGSWPLVLYVRTHGSPAAIFSAVRREARALGAGVPLREAITLEQEIQTSLWQERLVALLSAFFGAASALLAALGLYGALTYSVVQRTHELGIRVAVGARTSNIVRTVCSPIGLAVLWGVAAGLSAALFVLRATSPLLFGIQALDPVALAAASAIVVLCAAIAAVRPAWRAARVDPAVALREE